MGENPIEQKRGYFRLRYPAAEQATVQYKGRDYTVPEVSEGGIRILLDQSSAFREGQLFSGVIRFKDGGIAPIVGVVLRFDEMEMVVKLTKGISFNRMMEEQKRIRQKHPKFFNKE